MQATVVDAPRRPRRAHASVEKPLVLGGLEPDQLVIAKRLYGHRRLGRGTRALMWGLRLYLVLTLVVVIDRIARAAAGG